MKSNKLVVVLFLLFLAVFLVSCNNSQPITIEFDSMGGSEVASITLDGTTVQLPDAPVKAGYTFAGWFFEEEFIQQLEEDMAIEGSVRVYAKWVPTQYAINFNTGSNPIDAITYTIESDDITLPQPVERENYTFLGWYDAPQGGSQIQNVAKGTYGDINLYAKWDPETFSITYYNTKDATNNNMTSYTVEDEDIELQDLSKNGYNFLGWFDAAQGGTKIETIASGSGGSLELYAQWSTVSYAITYNNTKDAVNANPAQYTIETGTIELGSITAEGYNFLGWFDAAVGGNQVSTIPHGSTGARTLYAHWSTIPYSITYVLNNGTNHPDNPTTYDVESEDIVLQDAAKDDVGFIGWYDAAIGGEKVEVIRQGTTGNITLYAIFGQKFDINYNNIEDAENPNPSFYSDLSGEIILQDISRVGYEFLGWFDAAEGGSKVESIPAGSTGDIELYAYWDTINYDITYYNIKGAANANPATYTIESENIELQALEKDGYEFLGWFDAQVGGSRVITIEQGSAGDIEIYAHWDLIEYTISYTNTMAAENPNETTYTVESETIVLIALEVEGFNFDGWYDINHSGELVTQIPAGSTGNMTLVAGWILVDYSITYNNTKGAENTNPTEYTILSDTITLTPISAAHYDFIGWFDAAEGGSEVESIPKGSKGNIELYAHWEIIEYDIAYYNIKGAANANPATYTIESETIELEALEKDGYEFLGWFDAEEGGTEVTEIANGSFGNLELYAQWSAIEYSITYNNTYGAINPNPTKYTIETPTIVFVPLSAQGFDFSGWYDAEVGGTKVETIPLGSTGNLTLYARWSAVEYTITYNNTKGAENSNPAQYTIETDDIVFTPISAEGYEFLGWFDAEEDGTEVTEIASGSTGDVILFAQWNAIEYDIIYNNLEGAINDNPATYTIEFDEIRLEDLEREGYLFLGWFDAAEGGTEITVIANGSFGEIELYAYWETVTYTITYNNVKEAENENPTQFTIESDEIELVDLSLDGYDFLGWFDAAEGGNKVEYISSGTAIDITLYAHWNLIEYNIVYNNTKGADNPNPENYTIESEDITLEELEKEGYLFLGWFDAAEGGTEVTEIASGSTGEVVLYAQWSPREYSISYYNVEGADNPNEQTSYTIESPTIVLQDAEKENKVFLGWFDAEEGGSQVTEIPAGSTGDIELYAMWSENYSITYVLNGGVSDGDLPETYTAADSFILEAPIRDNYYFDGWYTEYAEGEFGEDIWGGHITKINAGTHGNLTLYAKWLAATAGLQYDLINDGTEYMATGTNNSMIETAIIASAIDGKKVTMIGSYAFNAKSSLTTVRIPTHVTTICDNAFYGCMWLSNIIFGDNSKLTTIENDAFYLCERLKNLTLVEGVETIGARAFGNCYMLESIILPNTVQIIDSYAFTSCVNLKVFKVPSSVTLISSTAFYASPLVTFRTELSEEPAGWVAGWNNSKAVVWDCNNNNLASDGNIYLYDEDGNYYRLVLGENPEDAVLSIVYSANQQGVIDFADGIYYDGEYYPLKIIGNRLFYFTSAVTGIDLPDTVERISENAFNGCNLGEVTIPASVKFLDNRAFSSAGITTLTFEAGSQLEIIGKSAFSANYMSGELILPLGLRIIEEGAFYYCNDITSIIIPNTVTGIGKDAFRTTGILEIFIPASVEDMGQTIFGVDAPDVTIYCQISQAEFEALSSIFEVNASYEIGFHGWNPNFAGNSAVVWDAEEE